MWSLITHERILRYPQQITPIKSTGTLKVELKTFSRPSGTLPDGSCCDINGCSCDPFFRFCWRGYLTSINSAVCSDGFITTTRYSESNTVNFGETINTGISNPLTKAVDNNFNVSNTNVILSGNNDVISYRVECSYTSK